MKVLTQINIKVMDKATADAKKYLQDNYPGGYDITEKVSRFLRKEAAALAKTQGAKQ